jgi:hypothetical protein
MPVEPRGGSESYYATGTNSGAVITSGTPSLATETGLSVDGRTPSDIASTGFIPEVVQLQTQTQSSDPIPITVKTNVEDITSHQFVQLLKNLWQQFKQDYSELPHAEVSGTAVQLADMTVTNTQGTVTGEMSPDTRTMTLNRANWSPAGTAAVIQTFGHEATHAGQILRDGDLFFATFGKGGYNNDPYEAEARRFGRLFLQFVTERITVPGL